MSSTFEKADEAFIKLADKAGASDKSRLLMDARNNIQKDKALIETVFKKKLSHQFAKKISDDTETQTNSDPLTAIELTLVDEKQVEESILISKMTNALQSECKGWLNDLTVRVGFLMDSTELELKDNPFNPQVILEAFSDATDQVELDVTAKFAIMNVFDDQLRSELPAIYKDINEKLISHNILREIKPVHLNRPKANVSNRHPSGSYLNTNTKPPHGGIAQTYTSNDSPATGFDQNPQELFSMLQQLLARNQSMPTQASGHGGIPDVSSIINADSAPIISADLLTSLNQIQRGEVVLTPVLPDIGDNVSANVGAVPINPAVPVNVLHNIKASSTANSIGQLDSVTIDIVAMLFDYIFNDPAIPEAMKNLIGRLQIPVLKAAMLDKSFFSSKANPARQLIDTLGRTVVNRGSTLEENDPLYNEAQRIVQKILNEFESDIGLFNDVLNEFESFLADEEKKNEEIIELSTKLIHERELQAIAKSVAEKVVNERLGKATILETIKSFLQSAWVKILTKIYIEYGEDSEHWKENIQVIDDLLWSITPKQTTDDRKHLLNILPELLKKMRQGVESVSIDETEVKTFFENLVMVHTQVIKLGLYPKLNKKSINDKPAKPTAEKMEAITPEPQNIKPFIDTQEPTVEDNSLVKNSIQQGNIQIEEIRLASENNTPQTNESDDDFYWTPSSLKRGQWVDFEQEDGQLLRYKLSWISPKKNVYLFTTTDDNQKALSISQQALEKQLNEKLIRIVADVAPIDRAMENMLGNLQK